MPAFGTAFEVQLSDSEVRAPSLGSSSPGLQLAKLAHKAASPLPWSISKIKGPDNPTSQLPIMNNKCCSGDGEGRKTKEEVEERWCATKMVCDKVVCDKVVCKNWCVTKWCVKDGV